MKVNFVCETCGRSGSRCYAQNQLPSHFFCSRECQNEWQKTREDIVAKNKDPEFRKKVSEGLKRRKKRLGDNYHSPETKKKIGRTTVEHWESYDDEKRQHQRLSVLKHMGETEAECVVVELDALNERALNVAMNKVSGEWDEDLLAELLKDMEESGFDLGKTGFEPPEIEQLFNSVHDKKVTEDDFDIDAELEKPAVAKMGDVWTLGRHRLVVGDSTLPETYDVLMAGAKANLVVTDPPYNANYEGSAGKIKNDNMPDKEFYQFLFAAFVNMEQNMESDEGLCDQSREHGEIGSESQCPGSDGAVQKGMGCEKAERDRQCTGTGGA